MKNFLSKLMSAQDRADRRFLVLVLLLRLGLNFLDFAALTGVGLLALALGNSGFNSGVLKPLSLPFVGEVFITAKLAVEIALLVTALFLLKSFAAVVLNLAATKRVAVMEAKATQKILSKVFNSGLVVKEDAQSPSATQNLVMVSTRSLFTEYIGASFVVVAEASLLAIILVGFLIVNPLATMLMCIYLSLIVVSLNYFVDRRLRAQSAESYYAAAASLAAVQDLHSIQREVRLARTAEFWINRVVEHKQRAATSSAMVLNLSSLPRYIVEAGLILGISGFIGGVVLFSDIPSQAMTIGIFLAGGLRLIASVIPLQSALNMQKQAATQGAAALHILSTINDRGCDPAEQGVSNQTSGPISIKFEHVVLVASDGYRVLDDINFELRAGAKYAFVGPSGAGKSSIFDVALGYTQPTSGSVTYGEGVTLECASNANLRVAYVPQRPEVVDGSLFENVTLGRNVDESSRLRVTEVLKTAGLSDLTTRFPTGLDAYISREAGLLSGGEMQRLGIARALYEQPQLLLLDEATSALDAETEASITETIDKLRGQVTIALIAHRLSTVQNADEIFYIENGRLVASGVYQNLIQTNANFAKAAELLKTF